MKKKIFISLMVAFIALFAVSAFFVIRQYTDEKEHTAKYEDLAQIVEQAETTPAEETPTEEAEDETLLQYMKLYGQNSDFVGWIKIDDTNISYPVMQSKNELNFYLKHAFDKSYSDYGCPYIQENCTVDESDNLVIYGHHMKNGSMFSDLEKYKNEDFYRTHKIISFDTLFDRSEYEIVAVFKTVAYSEKGFRYYDFVTAESADDFDSYITKCKELGFYDTGVNAEYGDKLITLSTCEYSQNNGRLVVVAKLITESGDGDVTGSHA